jgi:hypothetical protein
MYLYQKDKRALLGTYKARTIFCAPLYVVSLSLHHLPLLSLYSSSPSSSSLVLRGLRWILEFLLSFICIHSEGFGHDSRVSWQDSNTESSDFIIIGSVHRRGNALFWKQYRVALNEDSCRTLFYEEEQRQWVGSPDLEFVASPDTVHLLSPLSQSW